MNKITQMAVLGILILLSLSCKDKSTNSDESSPISFSAESTKCLTHGLPKRSTSDSTFSYSFTNNLVIDFSVSANCCPDSNRFSISQNISNDTLIVSVSDTASNQCWCDCLYMIHAEYEGLPQDHYVVRCKINYIYDGYVIDPIHLVSVSRTK